MAEFEEVRDRLREDYQLEVAEQLYFEQVEQLANLAFEHPDTLEVAAEALDVPLRETGLLSRNADESQGLAAEPRFLDAAFSPEVLEEGNNSELLEFEGAVVAVLRVKEHRPAREQDFDSVREEARIEFVAVRSAERAREAGEAIIDRLRGREAEDAIASEIGLEWSPEGSLLRAEPTPSPGLSGLVFRMPKPEAGGASSYDGLAEGNGDFVVVALRAVDSGDGDDADEESMLRERLASELGRAELAATVASFRADADIVVNEENLQ